MKKENIILFGASGHAKVIIDILLQMNEYHLVGLLDEHKAQGSFYKGYSILGTLNDLNTLCKKEQVTGGIVAIGDNFTRAQKVKSILALIPDFKFIQAIYPNSYISDSVNIGVGSVVMPGVTIHADTHIGNHVIVNTNASIDHDCQIKNYVSIAPNATLGGLVTIGDYTSIGLGAGIIQDCTIGSNTLVGAGATCTHDLPDNVLALGLPAKIIRQRTLGDRSL